MSETPDIDARTAAREAALRAQLNVQRRQARPEDFVFDKQQGAFWDLLDGTLHEEKVVDASIPREFWRMEVTPAGPRTPARERLIRPSADIMRVENDQFVECSTWWPGREQIINDWFVSGDGMWPAEGRRIYNQYRPIPEALGTAEAAAPWIEHVKRLWPRPEEHEGFFNFCAHMVQRPGEKCNHGVVLSGKQGIGKDSALQPVRDAVGVWNCKDVEPDMLFKDFRPWLQTLMLVVNEAKPADDDFSAISLYNTWKPWMAAPPATLPVNDKHVKIRHIVNLLRVIVTTNNWLDLYIPPDDRRMFIMHSALEKGWHIAAGEPDYFDKMWGWIHSGGSAHVAAWLAQRDLSSFNPHADAPKTEGWKAVASTWNASEDGVAYALEALGTPDVVFGSELLNPNFDFQDEMAAMLRAPRKLGHRLSRAGYLNIPPIGERWTFKAGEQVFRSRTAFVREAAAMDAAAVQEAIRDRGQKIAERMNAARSAANDSRAAAGGRF